MASEIMQKNCALHNNFNLNKELKNLPLNTKRDINLLKIKKRLKCALFDMETLQ